MGRFPATRQSVIVATRSADPRLRERALEVLVSGYWRPVYKYLRVRWQVSVEDAQDLTQAFFAAALEGLFALGEVEADEAMIGFAKEAGAGDAGNADGADEPFRGVGVAREAER